MNQFSLFAPPVWTVSNITRYLRELLDSDETLQDIWVQGEISNLSRPVSGHIYFTLKDNSSSLRCVMWRNAALRMLSMPRDGEAVEVHGNFSIYEAGGQYQLYADTIRSLGEGALYQEFLRLKARLEAEGLFDPARKRSLPHRPQRIAIVTSSTGAALRDILNTLRRRYSLAAVFISPTPVQGSEAPPGIIAALEAAVRVANPDVIIVARGGGSIEDLWAFNDEAIARAIAACPIPVISGVGHETDFTIADFVSDLRAPTPTAAAELATPNLADLAADLQDAVDRLARSTQQIIEKYRWQLLQAEGRLRQHSPRTRLLSDRQRLDDLQHRAALGLHHNLVLLRAHLVSHQQRLYALNPSQVLQRGYAILRAADGRTIKSITQVVPGEYFVASLRDGDLGLIVKEIIPQPSQADNHG
jgi:exodeoxyribonuclease VII large subunit